MFKNDLLKGKRILVTGGGTGLGKEMSRYFLKFGEKKSVNERSKLASKQARNTPLEIH